MHKVLLSLEAEDRSWLEQRAKRTRESMSAVLRLAIKTLRDGEEQDFEAVMERAAGTWTAGDGLEYQRKIRSQWESS